MGQKVKPNWAKPGSQQKNVKNELTVTNHGAFKSELTIKEVMRTGNLVKITYTFKNLEKVSVPFVTVRSYGETSIGVFTDKKCEIVDMTFAGIGLKDMDLGKRGYITKTLKPGEIVEGVLYVSVYQTINKFHSINFQVYAYENLGYIGDWRNKLTRGATYSFANVPIIQYTIQGCRVGNVDFTKPISTLPKKAPGLYDYMKKEENVNEMDGYTETRVKFYYGYDLVFECVSTDEGPQKRFDEVTFYSSRFLTPNGCYPGMPMQEWVEKGAYLWAQYYEEWTRVGPYWSHFSGECADQTLKDAMKLGYSIKQFFIDFGRAHDKAMQKDPAAITKKALRKELFSEKNLLPSITIFIEK
jgi:hypothetical protein